MAYVPLDLPERLPEPVESLIRCGVEPLFQDVHWMLATTVGEAYDKGPSRQLQIPVAHMLLAAVSGISTELYRRDPSDHNTGTRFKQCLVAYFPWDVDPPSGVSNVGASHILYKIFRNPLVHSLGHHKVGIKETKIGCVFRGTAESERRVEELERLTVKPYSVPCLAVSCTSQTLWLDPLYWGVRKLVERWARDETEVAYAASKLR